MSVGPARSRDPTLLAVSSVMSSALGWANAARSGAPSGGGNGSNSRSRRDHGQAVTAASHSKHASHFTFPSPPSAPQFSSDSSSFSESSSESSGNEGEGRGDDPLVKGSNNNHNSKQIPSWKHASKQANKKRTAKQVASEKAAASAASRSLTMLTSDATRLKIMKTLRRQNTIVHTKLTQLLIEQQKLYWYLAVSTTSTSGGGEHASSHRLSADAISQLQQHQTRLDQEVERRSELLRETFLLREQELDLLHRSYQGLATRLLQAEDAIAHAIRQLQVARVPLAPSLEAYFASPLIGKEKAAATELTARDASRRGIALTQSTSAAATAAVQELQSQQQAAIDQERSRASLMLQLGQVEEEFRQADRAVRFLESQIMEEQERELAHPQAVKDPRWSLAVQEELAVALRKRDALAADVALLDTYCSTFVNELKLLREVLGKSLQQRVAQVPHQGASDSPGPSNNNNRGSRARGDSFLDTLKRKIDNL